MKPQNSTDRKRMKLRFIALYVVSLAMLGIIFAALGTGNKAVTGKSNAPDSGGAFSEGKELFRLYAVLQNDIRQLQKLDGEYMQLITDSAAARNKDFRVNKNLLENSLSDAEGRVSFRLDSMAGQVKKFSIPANRSMADSLIYFFRSALQNHFAIKNFNLLASATNSTAGGDKLNAVKWQSELQKKDKKIEQLEELLRKTTDSRNKPGDRGIAKDLKTAGKDDYLEKVNNSLRQDNDRLLLEIAKYRQFATNLEASFTDKVQTLEKQVNNMNAELYLAKVDCNLTRADAKQVVYNSRQRKDLLAEALKVLGNLALSGDPLLQQKVKEKTNLLQHISNTIRD